MLFKNIEKRDIINMIIGVTADYDFEPEGFGKLDYDGQWEWFRNKLEEQTLEYLVSFYNRKFGTNIQIELESKDVIKICLDGNVGHPTLHHNDLKLDDYIEATSCIEKYLMGVDVDTNQTRNDSVVSSVYGLEYVKRHLSEVLKHEIPNNDCIKGEINNTNKKKEQSL